MLNLYVKYLQPQNCEMIRNSFIGKVCLDIRLSILSYKCTGGSSVVTDDYFYC